MRLIIVCSHGIPVASNAVLAASIHNAVANNEFATNCTTAPTADSRAPRMEGGTGALASGIAVTT